MSSDEQIRDLWRRQSSEAFRASAEDIRRRVRIMERNLRIRTLAGFINCAVLAAAAIWWLTILSHPLQQVGAVLTIAGVLYVAWQLWRTKAGAGSNMARAAASGGLDSIAFHRAALARLRDFHRGVEFWSRLVLLIVGPLLLLVGLGKAHPEVAPTLRIIAVALGVLAAGAIGINLRLSRHYARRIESLDRLRQEA